MESESFLLDAEKVLELLVNNFELVLAAVVTKTKKDYSVHGCLEVQEKLMPASKCRNNLLKWWQL